MLNLQETCALNNLEHAIENAKETGCDCNGQNCYDCPFEYKGENGGYDCVLEKMKRLLDYVKQNNN